MVSSRTQTDPRLGENFDQAFRNQKIVETPTDQRIMDHVDPYAFDEFTLVNPYFVSYKPEQLLSF